MRQLGVRSKMAKCREECMRRLVLILVIDILLINSRFRTCQQACGRVYLTTRN